MQIKGNSNRTKIYKYFIQVLSSDKTLVIIIWKSDIIK